MNILPFPQPRGDAWVKWQHSDEALAAALVQLHEAAATIDAPDCRMAIECHARELDAAAAALRGLSAAVCVYATDPHVFAAVLFEPVLEDVYEWALSFASEGVALLAEDGEDAALATQLMALCHREREAYLAPAVAALRTTLDERRALPREVSRRLAALGVKLCTEHVVRRTLRQVA